MTLLRIALPTALSLAFLTTTTACTDAFLERAAHEPGATQDPSGFVLRTLKQGDGASPASDERVKVRYRGELVDGTVFDESSRKGEMPAFVVGTAIPCWREALKKMHVGEKARLVCPWYTTFAQNGHPPNVPRSTTLIFELELLAVDAPPPPESSPDLKLRTIRPGEGASPRAEDRVKVDYEGKLADGTVFDSSYKRGQPAVLSLGAVIPCWRLLIPRMHVGEKAELTCPSELAYGPKGSPPDIPPSAKLTFEVELLGIEK